MRLKPAGLWKNRDFVQLWASETVSQLGSQITIIALPLLAALSLDASAAQMGILTAAGTAPPLLIGLFAGVWVDRLRRRTIMIVTDVGRAAVLLTVPILWGSARSRSRCCARSRSSSASSRCSSMSPFGAEFLQWLMYLIAIVNEVSLRQSVTPDRLLGRVNATMRFLNAGMIPVGALIGGALGGMIGLRETLFVGVAGMLVTGVWVYFSPLRTTRDAPALFDDESEQPSTVIAESGSSMLPT